MADELNQLEDNQPDAVPAPDVAEGRARLGDTLAKKFERYKRERLSAETQWLKNVRQFLGKYDEDLAQNMEPGTSRAYPKITRTKCISMISRLMSLLFPAGEKNWGLSASPVPNLPAETLTAALEKWRVDNPGAVPTQADLDDLVVKTASDIAALQEQLIDDQLKDIDPYCAMDYEALARKVVFSAVLYGPGIAKGPMTVVEETSKFELDAAGQPQVVQSPTYRPYLDFVSCWDYYPDMSANLFAQMDGEFERHVYSKHQLYLLSQRSDFDGDSIRRYIDTHPDGNYQKYTYETQLQNIGGQSTNTTDSGAKYEVLEYWGAMSGEALRKAGLSDVSDEESKDDIRFSAWVLDKVVIKLVRNPFPEGTKVYHQFIFEEDEVNLLGSGLPPIMRDSQLAVASAARMLLDNASVVCGPNVEVDLDLLSPTQTDTSIKPRKVWLKEGANSGQRAVQSVSFDSHLPELTGVINLFLGFADSETFVNPVTGGDMDGVPGEAMRTTGGASMVYANAALPFRDIVRNFDQFTVSVIFALVQWNRIFSDRRDQIQGDTRPIPRGATSLMAKEIRAFALDNLANTLTEEEKLYLDAEAMFKQRVAVRDLPLDQLMASPEEVKRRKEAQAAQASQAQQQAQRMFDAQVQNVDSDTMKQLTQAQKNLDSGDVAVFKALLEGLNSGASIDELSAIANRARANRQPAVAAPAAPAVQGLPTGGA